jgi:hypothetical protein
MPAVRQAREFRFPCNGRNHNASCIKEGVEEREENMNKEKKEIEKRI